MEQTTIYESVKLLNRISRFTKINVSNYYWIQLHKTDLTFQGRFDGDIVKKLMSYHKVEHNIDANGFLDFRRTLCGIRLQITLG